jgi:DNA-binding transcriptional LysR family regulator
MDFKQLKTFCTIYEFNSFSAAAANLGYAQSTVTTQIKLLEEELKVTLFDRIGKKIYLTEEGEKLLPYAREIMQIERTIYNNVSAKKEPEGHLVIGTPESLCNLLVPHIIKNFKSKYPKVNIEIRLDTTKKLPSLLKNNEIDLAFIIGNLREMPDFKRLFLANEKMCFLVSPEHPLATKQNLNLVEICSYPLVLTSKKCEYRSALISLAEQNGITPNVALETSNVNAIKLFAANNLGVAFLPYVSVEDSINESNLVVLDFDEYKFNITSEILIHKDKHIFQAMEYFLEIANAYIAMHSMD